MKIQQKGRTVIRGVLLALGGAGVLWFLFPAAFGVWNVGSLFGTAGCAVLLALGAAWPQCLAFWRKTRKKKILYGILPIFILSVLWFSALTVGMAVGAARQPPAGTEGAVVVLGSKVNGTTPSADLAARIDRAAEYLLANPGLKAVASGGQGAGEDISEAQAIRDGLVQRGVEPERIFLEDASKNTEENLAFSAEVIREEGLPPVMLIVTDEYHEFRAWRIASRLGIESYAVSSSTPWYIFSACYGRELLALTKFYLFPFL